MTMKNKIIPFNKYAKIQETLSVKDLLNHFTGKKKLSKEKQEELKQMAKDNKNL